MSAFGIPFWLPHLTKNIIKKSEIAEEETKLIRGLKHHCHERRLEFLKFYHFKKDSELERDRTKGCKVMKVQPGERCSASLKML